MLIGEHVCSLRVLSHFAWSEMEFICSLRPRWIVHIIIFVSELWCIFIINAAAVYPFCLVTLVRKMSEQ